jgi:hypothetical protein
MSDADTPSGAGRELARARWGDSVVRRAAVTVIERRDELAPDLLADLRAAVGAQDGDGDG